MNVKEATESSEPMSMREGSRGEGGWYKERNRSSGERWRLYLRGD